MERFVAGVTEPVLRERLIISIDGKGAFRRFKDALLNYPVERALVRLPRRAASLAHTRVV